MSTSPQAVAVAAPPSPDAPPARFLPPGIVARSAQRLTGGTAHPVWRCVLDDGRAVVVKASADAAEGMFATEAAGLEVLAQLGGLPTPGVIAVEQHALVLEALEPQLPDGDAYWEAAGRAVAGLHAVRCDRHGWAADGWLGLFRQHNAWDTDGHRFFAEKRVLRYLTEPGVEAALDAADRAGIERLCARLPDLLPDHGAALTHGDLWRNNLIASLGGGPVFVDPAVSYAWPEIDVAMMFCTGGVPEVFFDAYAEVRPLDAGWREHARILNLRELLAVLATCGPNPGYVTAVREVVARYV
ncbi:fructosamine kinase family protein [Xylanimonas sp. McL0601]|uniref:fructosamine kinase family protein n=1 Tax=Xylanimonas sp. McL0601 TaxID=3414739 RepID=UPI003CEDFCDC